jgi:xanthine dehydrogenase accessory factor
LKAWPRSKTNWRAYDLETPMKIDPNEIVERYCRDWDGVTPYARATIVHTNGAVAAKAGAKAVVTSDGTLIGWIGGGCIRGAVLRAARQAMDAAVPRLIRVRPRAEITADHDSDGVEIHPSGCPGRGRADVFIEPVMPKPPLVVIGASHTAYALADIASGLSVEIVPIDGGADSVALSALGQLAGLDHGFIVIATQGTGDHAALTAALATDTPYIAFIASRAKVAAIRERLAAEGVSPAALARLRSPAGLSIGAKTPAEIAIAVLAEIISLRRTAAKESRA